MFGQKISTNLLAFTIKNTGVNKVYNFGLFEYHEKNIVIRDNVDINGPFFDMVELYKYKDIVNRINDPSITPWHVEEFYVSAVNGDFSVATQNIYYCREKRNEGIVLMSVPSGDPRIGKYYFNAPLLPQSKFVFNLLAYSEIKILFKINFGA